MWRTLKLTIAYDGSEFSGWQVQPDRVTIQGTLADAIERITGERVMPQGSGRTDAGVHAVAQVASVVIQSPIPVDGFQRALNSSLPESVRILGVEAAAPDFHARKCAKAKTYEYRLYRGPIAPPFLARYVEHHPWPLDEPAMMQGARFVEGEHDFTSFAAVDMEKGVSEESRSKVRRIYSSRWERRGDELIYTVRGSGFLHHMVRNLVGTFLLLGKRTVRPEDIVSILAARNRSANPGATAGARGLYLVSVEY